MLSTIISRIIVYLLFMYNIIQANKLMGMDKVIMIVNYNSIPEKLNDIIIFKCYNLCWWCIYHFQSYISYTFKLYWYIIVSTSQHYYTMYMIYRNAHPVRRTRTFIMNEHLAFRNAKQKDIHESNLAVEIYYVANLLIHT